ncbi:Hcp family type VI secretion system effector [Haloferula helveola]|uniref:Hcp family type VI secretion system effector n=1 Tax=Haloferula helveola TaxID=490095 RepID=A0ABN6H531_9BACT|nr:Hcp family type VI secretion system effector [Haloferula helveola]
MKLISLLVTATFLVTASVRAALPAFAEINMGGTDLEGEHSYPTFGGIDVSTMIQVTAFRHEVLRGISAGRVEGLSHKPITITKPIDKATPLLYRAISDEQTGTVRLNFFNNDPDTGQTQHFFTIELTGAKIVRVQPWLASTYDPAAANLPPQEEVTIYYDTMTITSESGGTTTTVSSSDR